MSLRGEFEFCKPVYLVPTTYPMTGGMRTAGRRPAKHQSQPLEAGEVYAVTMGLGDIHHTVHAGSRLQVDIVSSNFPRRARNTNSGHPVLANDGEADIRVATNTVYHTAATPSFVEMSILSG